MLKLCDISMYYQNGTNVTVGVQQINTEFHKGEFVAITGESGSGKTTLLSVISSITPYHDGEMYFKGEPTSGFDEAEWENYRKEHIGFIFQSYNLIESYTVLQNVISAMLIRGVKPDEAKRRALAYLDRVGLKDLAWRRASKLSSGQKQRLTIARALAKETDIIIADEPTGNLDSANGRSIVELLAKLSKEKLVIMVSHNIEEAEEFATRMIRMKDGRIISDVLTGHEAKTVENAKDDALLNDEPVSSQAEPQSTVKNDSRTEPKKNEADSTKGAEKKQLSSFRLAVRLAAYNRSCQPVKATIITLFMAVVAIAGFIFLGSVISNMDDTPAKVYDNSAFLNGDSRRIVIKHSDGSPITEEDVAFFESLPNVIYVDPYDYSNDCCYYYRENVDYKYAHSEIRDDDTGRLTKESIPVLLNNTNFIRTANGLTADDLAYGRMPQNSNEIVLYSADDSPMGSVTRFFFSDPDGWPIGECLSLDMTVVGILKESTTQIYFHENIAKAFVLSRSMSDAVVVDATSEQISYYPYYPLNPLTIHKQVFRSRSHLFPDATLEAGQMMINPAFFGIDPSVFDLELPPESRITDLTLEYIPSYHDSIVDPMSGVCAYKLENIIHKLDYKNEGIGGRLKGKIVLVDDETFNVNFASWSSTATDQASVYVSDYAYAVETINRITAGGEYVGISPFRIGSTQYDQTKVKERFVSLIISLVAMVAVFALEVVILYSLMKLKRDDYGVFKSMGMTNRVMTTMNITEIYTYNLLALIIAAVVVGLLWYNGMPLLMNYTKYYRWQHLAIVAASSIAASGLFVAWFNHYLDKQFKGKRIAGENGR